MKIGTIIFAFLILAIAFSAQMTSQKHMASKLGNSLRQSHLGNGILSLVNLYAKQKQGGDEKDFEPLFEALDHLLETLKQKIVDENNSYAEEQAKTEGLIEVYKGQIDELKFARMIVGEALDGGQSILDGQKTALLNLQGQRDAAQASIKGEQEILDKAEESYNNQIADFDASIELLEQAIEHLEQALASAQSAELPSFLQKNQMQSQQFSILIEKQVQRASMNAPILLQPITQIFAEMENQQEVQTDRIANVITLLNNLVGYLNTGKTKLTVAYKETVSVHEGLIKEFQGQLGSVGAEIKIKQQEIQATQESVDEFEGFLNQIDSELSKFEAFLQKAQTALEQRKQQNETVLAQLNGEIAIVEQAIAVLSKKPVEKPQEKPKKPTEFVGARKVRKSSKN